MTNTQLLIGGQWTAARSGETEEVRSPFDGSRRGRGAHGRTGGRRARLGGRGARRGGLAAHARPRADADPAAGGRARRRAHRRRSPRRSAPRTARRSPRRRREAGRSGDLIRLSAFEGTQLYGDTLPLDANTGTGFDKIGFTVRQPVRRRRGDHPVQLPVAAGAAQDRARRWRPGTRSCSSPPAPPRSPRWRWPACFVDAGLPEGVLSVLTGPGGALGDALVADPRVRKVSFTGSTGIGERIAGPGRGEEAVAGARRVLPGGDHAGRRPGAGVERGRRWAVSPTPARSASRCSG